MVQLSLKMRHSSFLFITVTLACRGLAQDITFPRNEESPQLSGNNPVITERIPVYIPTRCPDNMLLYPGQGDKSSWVCDCKPKWLYFPLNNTCHEAFRQGPCLPGNYVHLPVGEVVPRCAENPCLTDGMVPFDGRCWLLGSSGPCGPTGRLSVDPTSFQVACTVRSATSTTRVYQRCPAGSRGSASGACRNST